MPAPDLVIFDLDGTLADPSARVHHLDGTHQGFHEFHIRCAEDPVNEAVKEVAVCMTIFGFNLWVVTSRPVELKTETREWLRRYGIVPDNLIMRPVGDTQPGAELKRGWLRSGVIPKDAVLCVFDDRAGDVAMWREEGLVCFQVAEGSF